MRTAALLLLAFTPVAPLLTSGEDGDAFRLVDVEGARECHLGERVLWRHLTAFDPERLEETCKPYTELLAPSGEALTKRAGGLYPHHRGLFLGWSRVRVGEASHDLWSMGGDPRPTQRHLEWDEELESIDEDSVTVAARAEWRAADGAPLVRDLRTWTTRRPVDGRVVLDVEVRLEALVPDLQLDGDPRHGGLQVRLAQECAERADVVYSRPAGAEELGNDDWGDCGWLLARYSVAGSPHAIAILDHAGNPRPTIYNTRDYGRFGPFFRAALPRGEPLVVRYRVVLWDLSERDAPEPGELDALYADFVATPR